jgi:hypothetical protein
MEVSERFRQYLAERPGKTFNKDGYTIKVAIPDASIYATGDKQLTLTGKLFKKESTWWIFGSYFGMYLEGPLRWDNMTGKFGTVDSNTTLDDNLITGSS